ncbi:MAG: WYL domain-containing protein [Ignavibacteria bacterium]|nr:WYL domain-containing protein [Ignavibacteria bacterium]
MSEYIRKVKRQIEIIGKALSSDERFTITDLAVEHNVEELTIKRDLAELRSRGISIHSLKKEGIKILQPLKKDLLKEFILEFISFSYSEDYPDKSTMVLIQKLGEKALLYIVKLQKAIENNLITVIDYRATANTLKTNIFIQPLRIFQAQGEWRLLALNQNLIKQYFISKIEDIRLTSDKFKPYPKEKIDSLFASSLKSWIGTEQFPIKIIFDKNWSAVIKSKTYLLNQKISDYENGSVLFEGIVNSLDEAATWVLSFGKGVKVLEPEELKVKVIQLAKDVLANYE